MLLEIKNLTKTSRAPDGGDAVEVTLLVPKLRLGNASVCEALLRRLTKVGVASLANAPWRSRASKTSASPSWSLGTRGGRGLRKARAMATALKTGRHPERSSGSLRTGRSEGSLTVKWAEAAGVVAPAFHQTASARYFQRCFTAFRPRLRPRRNSVQHDGVFFRRARCQSCAAVQEPLRLCAST